MIGPLPACGWVEPPSSEEALLVRLCALARTLGAVEGLSGRTHLVAGAQAGVSIEGLVGAA